MRDILDGAELKQLQKLQRADPAKKNWKPRFIIVAIPFSTGIGMADILAHLHVDEDTLSAAVLYRARRFNSL